ncbi:CPBP family intramembrane metalloprotease [Spiractinospora alimapuensis]|uniref:CPBP family intramembrane glutamic endopeptidase n=1 Tax=Spiractinospora alimapuensis TaxID=2820884 RepID=UPI001F48FC86|nr:type II CAAX endopeptidase family protein [Spiractinospora alimapuensis]QVQ50902.1 CPBP family intramembrane metalloprotease [Spiractinospora alimapuensis]
MATHTAPSQEHTSTSAPDLARATTLAPRGLTAFFVIAFAFSWTAWWAGTTLVDLGDPMPVVILGSFGPMVAAILVTAATQGRRGVGALFRRYSLRHRGGIAPYVIAALVVLAIAASAAVPVLLGEAFIDEGELNAALAIVPIQFLVIALAGGGNEELGWRGFAQPRLQGALPPLAANVLLGGIWAVWHAPLFAVAGTAQADMSFPAYALLCVGLTVVLGHVFNAARGGVLAPVLAHAAINVVSGLKATLVGSPASPVEIACVALAALLLMAVTRNRLGLRAPAAETPDR